MIKIIIGLALGLIIGGACRYFQLPVPAPPNLLGAALVMATTLGYVVTDRYIIRDKPPTVQVSVAATSTIKKSNIPGDNDR